MLLIKLGTQALAEFGTDLAVPAGKGGIYSLYPKNR